MASESEMFNELIIRPPTRADIPAIVDMTNADALQYLGASDLTVAEYEAEWAEVGIDKAAMTRIATTRQGEFVAMVEAHCHPPYVRNFLWGRVHPAYGGRGLGAYLNQWGEAYVRGQMTAAPADARVTVGCTVIQTNQGAAALFQGLGYQHVRSFYTMAIAMDTPPPAPAWPEGITVRTMQPGEEAAVYRAIDESFQDHWGHVDTPFEESFPRWQHYMLNDPDADPSLWFLALAGDEIAGCSLCKPKITAHPDMGWVNQLGVRREWRRQGLALALLHHTFGEFYRRGTKKVGLGVDASSLTGATRLYEKAGMAVLRQFDTYEKELRPGRDLTTQAA